MRRRWHAAVAAITVAIVWAGAAGMAQAATWHLHPGQSIQAAVNHASPGDVIKLAPGTYHQNVTIQKNRITLIGSGWGQHGTRLLPGKHPTPSPCTDPSGVNGICVAGQFDSSGNPAAPVHGTRIRNLSVHGFSAFGIVLFNANDSTVSHVLAGQNKAYGISGFVLSGVTFTHNVARFNGEPGFYIGDSPHANATVAWNRSVANGVGGPEGIGFLFRDSSWGKVWGNTAVGNCAGMVFVDTGEDPLPATHWTAWSNQSNANNGSCVGEQGGAPPLSGIGITLFGASHSVLMNNVARGNRPTGPSVFSGGIVVASSIPAGGANPVGNLIKGNTAHSNSPFDILYDGSGSGNTFTGNHCDTSDPGSIC